MIHIGIGISQVRSCLAVLNIPPPSSTYLTKLQGCVRLEIKEVAEKSCQEALKDEQKLWKADR